ncbi:MAG: hypothetical protein R3190_01655 [Thermoanaerobaculia bacterium]|nr:hypothetical protein [Thermoanaerobaculia bacterium]
MSPARELARRLAGVGASAKRPRVDVGGRLVSASALAAVLTWAAPVAASATEEFHFEGLDRTYENLVEELQPIEMGVVQVTLRSPEHELTLADHRVRLEPLGKGLHDIWIRVDFSGGGLLDADLKVGVVEGHLEDELTLPDQTVEIEGRVVLRSDEDGWTVTVVDAPKEVEVAIQSRMAGRMVPLCKQMALVLVRFDCAALEDAMSRVRVPMPKPGEQFLLPRDELSEAEAEALDSYVSLHR